MLDAATVGQAFTSVPLRSVGRFVRGITFKPDDVVNASDATAIFCMRTKNVQAELDLSDVWGISSAFVKREEQFLQPGDILVSSANSWNLIGKCCWIPALERRATFGGFVSVLRADPKQIEPRYLYRWFASDPVQAKLRSFGRQTTNISNLDLERCLAMQLPLPSLSEQRRIAAILDEADALRAKRRAALAQLDEMARAIFVEMFGDAVANPKRLPVRPLSDVIDPVRPITYGILKPGPDIADGVPYVRVVDMANGAVKVGSIRRTSPEIAREYRRSTLRGGDLLISIRGHVGRVAVTPPELSGGNITQDTARLAVVGVDALFLQGLLESDAVRTWMERRTKGAAVQGINLGDLRQLPVLVPPASDQRAYASRLQQLRAWVQGGQAQRDQLDSLFASLQHRAFRGEL